MKIIPAIDLQQGLCVRLRQGKFNHTTIYPQSPLSLVKSYSQRGAKHLHVVDLDGAKSGEIKQLALIKSMKSPGMTLQAGGGIRSLASAKAFIDAGIDKLVIGSIAITMPELTEQIIKYSGAEAIVIAIDVNIENALPKPAIHGWQKTTDSSLWEVVDFYQQLGIVDVLCTDIACDGMMNGPNISLYREAVRRFPALQWQASGGIRNPEDIDTLSTLGISAAIVGRALYESEFDLSCTSGSSS
ncbi:MAG: 1-(5-phosphoribosyl)-5-[(5-phosphoribosylamino)methylideneamino] imidazole-4-carboxamide isomerase [Legionella sp.]|nr:1-(5-phosphoribosyl)-5-[(5-phosphoribosylamino)methylideneamino] imidazole-4-carboxamide isomerase [Legionella sp.]